MLKELEKDKSMMPKKAAKYLVLACMILYAILFPLFFYMGILSAMVFDSPSMPTALGLAIIFLTLLISISMLVSIYLMRSRYRRGLYKEALLFSCLPVITFTAVVLLISALEALFHPVR